jgi:hypothetical protein
MRRFFTSMLLVQVDAIFQYVDKGQVPSCQQNL